MDEDGTKKVQRKTKKREKSSVEFILSKVEESTNGSPKKNSSSLHVYTSRIDDEMDREKKRK